MATPFKIVRVPAKVDTAYCLLLGDAHAGHKCYNESVLDEYLKRAADLKAFIVIVGDLIECATKTSPGKGYEDTNMPTSDQLKYWKAKLKPHKERIVGAVVGNHEERLQVDVMDVLCEHLDCTYFGYSGVLGFATEKASPHGVSMAVCHGSGGGVMPGGAVNAARRAAWNVVADAYVSGHVHKVTLSQGLIEVPDWQHGTVMEKEQLFITNGALLDHRGSYGEMKGYAKSKPCQVFVKMSMLSRNRGIRIET